MNKLNLFLLAALPISLILVAGCKQTTPADANKSQHIDSTHNVLVSVDSISNKKQDIHIDTFSKSPETDSCSCLFAIDSALNLSKQYIFAYDLSMIAYMKVNGVMTKFTQTEYTGAGENTLIYFNSAKYKLILESADSKEIGKEKTIQTGSIRVTDKEGNAFITTFYGICGCFKKMK